jgi:peptide/nickel transport system substrate-binding protein
MDSGNYWSGGSRLSRRAALRTAGIAGAGLAGVALLGCSDDDDDAPLGGDVDARRGGTFFSITTGPQDNFNQVVNWWEANQLSGIHVYDRPISPRPDERVYVLEAADSIELPDETTVVMTLKEGLVYQDLEPVNGRAVDAQDIVEMQLYVRDEPNAANRSFQQMSMASIEASDDRTVTIRLNAPNAYLFSSWQLGNAGNNCLVPREILLQDFHTIPPVGSGPYQLTHHQFGTRYEYERNPTYRRSNEGMPYIDERHVIGLVDASAIEAAFRSEQTHLWIPPIEVANRLERDLGERINVFEFLTYSAFTWNMSSKREAFDDIRVREAFYRIFDPQEYIDLIQDGHAVPVPGMLPASQTEYLLDSSETEQFKRHDLDEAGRLLDAAGFNFDQTWELSSLAAPANEQGLQVMEGQLRRAGIRNFRYNIRPAGEWIAAESNNGQYDLCVVGHPAEDTAMRMLRLNHSDTRDIIQSFNIGDPEIDEWIDRSETLMDRDEHIEAVKTVQRLLMEKYAHLAHIYTAETRQLLWSYVQDFEFNPATHPMYRPEMWLDA